MMSISKAFISVLSPALLKAVPVRTVVTSLGKKSAIVLPKTDQSSCALSKKLTVSDREARPRGVLPQTRSAHSDIKVPDFSRYRRSGTQNSQASSQPSAAGRHVFSYAIAASGTVAGIYATKTVMNEYIASLAPSADVLALAKIEVKLAEIPEGKNVTVKWRGTPLFIRHRSAEEIKEAQEVDVRHLRHPQKDSERVKRPEWLVVLGVCTHLGCVPIPNAGDYGGYYCPCHGSHYDISGRIRKGPAPLNLEVPDYCFPEPGILVVGNLS